MVIYLNELLPTILYILLFVLIIVLIVLGFKAIKTLDKVDKVVDDVNNKSKKLNGLFDIIDGTADGLSQISDLLVGGAVNVINHVFKRNKKGDDLDE